MTYSNQEKVSFLAGYAEGYASAMPSNAKAQEAAKKNCLARFEQPTSQQKADCFVPSIKATSEEFERWKSNRLVPEGKFGEIVEATDRFFAEPENRPMPISAAWAVVQWKREGKKQAELDALMDTLRENYLRLPRKGCKEGVALMTPRRCESLGVTFVPASK